MRTVNISIILEVYESILNEVISFSEADRWAFEMMELYDEDRLKFIPSESESYLWDLIQYLYGLDMPSMDDRNKTGRSYADIVCFLNEKNIKIRLEGLI